MMPPSDNALLTALLQARSHDPFSFLGLHPHASGWVVRVFLPHAQNVQLSCGAEWQPMMRTHPQGFHEWTGKDRPPSPCRIRYEQDGRHVESFDPYSFTPTLSDHDLYLFNEGRLQQAYATLGAHIVVKDGVKGTRFAVWAPAAERVSVVGDFNRWDGRVNPMRVRGSSGVWELFLPGVAENALYKFEIRNRHSGAVLLKTDPYGFCFEKRPGNASKVCAPNTHVWKDREWIRHRSQNDWLHAPLNIYEVHLGSWQASSGQEFDNYLHLADRLIPYVKEAGYTHIELMPVSEHPLDESWGYQTTGYYGVTSRYGTPEDFREFVDRFHQAGLGVILDWVPGHFPKDDFALARFDGSALYEHEDPRLGEHQDWGTYIFNYGRSEVRSFLIGNAHYWLSEFHVDGLRVDAVASMLYLDYSRKAGEWLPNRYGGRENLDAIDFIQAMNMMVHTQFPGVLTIAEESTSWPMVSRPIHLGGLGFSMKWNMGWMNDTLRYFSRDPLYRVYHHNELTFGQLYAYTENFVLPFSHDEVVHGKCSLLDKMPGDAWQKFANLRLLMVFQMTSPGKKLNFMGNEFGQGREWQVKSGLDWHLLQFHWHQGIQALSRDLNWLYRNHRPMNELDFYPEGFSWIDCNDSRNSVLSYLRKASDGSFVVVALNFTPNPLTGYRIGVPARGSYRELLNSDSTYYGGSNMGNGSGLQAQDQPWSGQPYSISAVLPPLGAIVLASNG
jgi:1,4-alpha-glucan branching enzyme